MAIVTLIAKTKAAVTTPVAREILASEVPATIIAGGFGAQGLVNRGAVKILMSVDGGSTFEDYTDGDGPVSLTPNKKTQTIISPIFLGITKTETVDAVGVFLDID